MGRPKSFVEVETFQIFKLGHPKSFVEVGMSHVFKLGRPKSFVEVGRPKYFCRRLDTVSGQYIYVGLGRPNWEGKLRRPNSINWDGRLDKHLFEMADFVPT